MVAHLGHRVLKAFLDAVRIRRPIDGRTRTRLLLERLEDRTCPADFSVTSLNNAGAGSLRAAIVAVNASQDTINTITLWNLSGTISLATELDTITNNVTILGSTVSTDEGSANTVTVARSSAGGTADFSVFEIGQFADVSIEYLIITNGRAPNGTSGGGITNYGTLELVAVDVNHNVAPGLRNGGGINNTGTLTVDACTIWENTASRGGGIFNADGGSITIQDSSMIELNHSVGLGGGGIWNAAGASVLVTGCGTYCIYANDAARGGGIYNSGTFTMNGGYIYSNSLTGADSGGGIYDDGTASFTNVTFTGNSAGNGGGFYLAAGGSLTLDTCTVSGNSAVFSGAGGYYIQQGTTYTVTNCTLSDTVSHN